MNPNTQISPHFQYHEFFSSGILSNNNEAFLMKLLDPRLVPLMELIRNSFGKSVYCNNWYYGGNSQYRGFRPWTTTVGARYSQHKFGRAIDFQVKDISPNEVRQYLLANEDKFMKAGISRMEDGRDAPTWVHIDLAWTGLPNIVVFRA